MNMPDLPQFGDNNKLHKKDTILQEIPKASINKNKNIQFTEIQ